MKTTFKLDKGKILELQDGEEVRSFPSVENFLNHEEIDFVKDCYSAFDTHFMKYVSIPSSSEAGVELELDEKKATKKIEEYLIEHFEKFFEKHKEVDEKGITDEFERLEKELITFGETLGKATLKEIEKTLKDKLVTHFHQPKTGGDMFKTIKEAKAFTAHLDALATEIEELSDVSPEMKKHLAYRLDRLSDMIEGTSKEASVNKGANGIGQGAWVQDEDEKYMNTMGGTGALEGDKDEAVYMNQFKGDDHREVLDIADGGKKYNEGAVAKKIRETVRNMMKNK